MSEERELQYISVGTVWMFKETSAKHLPALSATKYHVQYNIQSA